MKSNLTLYRCPFLGVPMLVSKFSTAHSLPHIWVTHFKLIMVIIFFYFSLFLVNYKHINRLQWLAMFLLIHIIIIIIIILHSSLLRERERTHTWILLSHRSSSTLHIFFHFGIISG